MAEACSAAEVLANGHCSTICNSSCNGREEDAACATTAAAAADGETVGTAAKLCEVVAAAEPTAAAADADATQTGNNKQETAAQDAAPSEGKETAASGGPPPPSTAANGKPVNSVLRSSIARYGSNSYYYAHAPLPGAAEDAAKFVKVTEAPGVVTGGPPILLGRTTAGGEGDEAGAAAAAANDAALLSPADAAAAAAAGKKLSGFTILQSYMWTDDGARVSVYVQLEKLPESPEEKEAEPSFDTKTTAATFEEESAALVIYRKAKKYLLNLHRLYFPIKPSESRILVKNDKIVLRLVKEDENLTWFGLMKSK